MPDSLSARGTLKCSGKGKKRKVSWFSIWLKSKKLFLLSSTITVVRVPGLSLRISISVREIKDSEGMELALELSNCGKYWQVGKTPFEYLSTPPVSLVGSRAEELWYKRKSLG